MRALMFAPRSMALFRWFENLLRRGPAVDLLVDLLVFASAPRVLALIRSDSMFPSKGTSVL